MYISKGNYGKYSSDNYGSHTQKIHIGDIVLYFSYDTVIGVYTPKYGFVVSENIWSRTTGKHLNWIMSNKSKRVKNEVFNNILNKIFIDMKWSAVLN